MNEAIILTNSYAKNAPQYFGRKDRSIKISLSFAKVISFKGRESHDLKRKEINRGSVFIGNKKR